MKVLVTGAAGYIGSTLVGTLLAAGHEVRAMDDLSCGSASLMGYAARPRFEFIKGDVWSTVIYQAMVGADAIIPLAAVVGMPACDREPVRARSTIVDAIRLMLARRSPSQRIVFPTTNSGYGTTAPGTVCTEKTPLKPVSLYGRLKAEAEDLILSAENTVSLRLATVFGLSPRMRKDLLVNAYVWEALTKKSLGVFDGSFRRNFVHVKDVAKAFLAISTGAAPAVGVYNFGNDDSNLSKSALAQKVAEATGASVYDMPGSDPDRRDYLVSSAKLAAAGVRATISLDAGISELIRGYRTMPELYR